VRHVFAALILGTATMALFLCMPEARPAAAQAHAPASGKPSADAAGDTVAGVTGKVVETMNAGNYTYVQVDDGSKKIWAAAPQFVVAVGDKVVVPDGMAMRDFYSKTLGRTFDIVSFVPSVQVVGGKAAEGQAGGAGNHPGSFDHPVPGHGATGAAAVDLSNIKKAEGGETVAELFSKKAALAGKDVSVRGRVVKFTPAVMGKNWLHVQDGSGSAGSNDLTVSTSASAAVGNTVLVRGKLSTDKDFGFGYKYDVLIEDATVAVE
jgi:hypothetical protein